MSKPLSALWAEYLELRAWMRDAKTQDATAAVEGAVCTAFYVAEDAIAEALALTQEDVLIKLKLMAQLYDDGRDMDEMHKAILRTALEGVQALLPRTRGNRRVTLLKSEDTPKPSP